MSSPEEGVSIRFICPESPPPLPEQGLSRFRDWRREGRVGFLSLPGDLTLLRQCTELWEEVRTKLDPSDVVVAGIGGSALGLRALRSACGAGPRNAGRDVRFHLVDSPDVETIDRVTSVADPRRTLLVAITKSGGTAETLACFMELLGWLDEESGMVVAVTDPEKGDLRRLARSRGWRTLPVPPAVGGRFSVLSPVGLFPAMVLGIDCAALLEGAASALEDFDSNGMESVAGRLARAFLAHFVTHRVHAFFPYCDALFETALWFAQLWGESLGKKLDLDGRQVSIGQTPIACRGPADQHSLLQLFMEGPPDTFLTFLVVRQEIRPLPGGFGDLPAFC
ncbi:hypothetical protein JW921_11665, partial [Candidatus Fermentibacterales bacterium]|nr:hypothetical protein [Candidatus Fermentibacterales bacterium]